jgi:uncharacterized phiE125 gp8 family phage protein
MKPRITNLIEVEPPGVEPIALDRAKLHCRVTHSAEDELITGLIVAAREVCEAATRRAFVSRPFRLILPYFPWCAGSLAYADARTLERAPLGLGPIMLPKPPLVSVESIDYIEPATGELATLDPARYVVVAGGRLQGSVEPVPGVGFPATRAQHDAVRIDYTAGYGTSADAVPAAIGQAMLLLVGHWYRAREAATETPWSCLPLGVRALLTPHRWGSYA